MKDDANFEQTTQTMHITIEVMAVALAVAEMIQIVAVALANVAQLDYRSFRFTLTILQLSLVVGFALSCGLIVL